MQDAGEKKQCLIFVRNNANDTADRIEAYAKKSGILYTKMRNVAGIAQTEAQKSSDMFAKCQYLDEVICCEV